MIILRCSLNSLCNFPIDYLPLLAQTLLGGCLENLQDPICSWRHISINYSFRYSQSDIARNIEFIFTDYSIKSIYGIFYWFHPNLQIYS